MTDIVGLESAQDHRPFSAKAAGEDGAWARWIPRAWHAVGDVSGLHSPPERPIAMGGPGHGRVLNQHAELLAWWSPFTQLIMFGLGWPNPNLGIARWHAMGRPTVDPILGIVARWWGPDLQPFLNWSRSSAHFIHVLQAINVEMTGNMVKSLDEAPLEGDNGRNLDVRWFGPDADSMHVTAHLTPTEIDPRAKVEIFKRRSVPGQPNRAVLLLDCYQGWYTQLSNLKLPETEPGRGWRVDVVVEPLGWLGQYRLSRESNRWFRGQHRWHQLGI